MVQVKQQNDAVFQSVIPIDAVTTVAVEIATAVDVKRYSFWPWRAICAGHARLRSHIRRCSRDQNNARQVHAMGSDCRNAHEYADGA